MQQKRTNVAAAWLPYLEGDEEDDVEEEQQQDHALQEPVQHLQQGQGQQPQGWQAVSVRDKQPVSG